VFPLGNVSASAATLYGVFAVGWVVLNWRDARHGLLFVSGPLLAGIGLLPLVPLVLQRAQGTVRRAAQGALAVLSAVLLAGVAGHRLPVADEPAGAVGIDPLTPVSHAGLGVWSWLAAHPATIAAAVLVAAATALVPLARRISPFGVWAIGFALTAASVVAGASVASTVVVLLGWAVAGGSTIALRRVS
jgi:hypothetical protein